MSVSASVRVYDDGHCPFCQWAQQTITRFDRDHRLDFRDYNLPEIAAETPFPREQLDYRMHVQTPDGQWHAGFFGWMAILRVLPRWRWLARVMSAPPIRWLGPVMYQFVADHRYQVPHRLLRFLGAPQPCDARCDVIP
jgi:predicted DCC family thiol-disulfide oxidoreductase YuxK